MYRFLGHPVDTCIVDTFIIVLLIEKEAVVPYTPISYVGQTDTKRERSFDSRQVHC